MAQNIDQIENLQLRLESGICGLSVEALSKFAQHEVSEDKKALLEGYFDLVNPEPPPLEVEENEVATSSETNNGTALPYSGWSEIDFFLIGTNRDYGLKVPFLVCKDVLDQPVIGYNVIEEITRKSSATSKSDEQPPFLDVLFCSLRNIGRCKVEALVTIIHSEKTIPLCNVR